jgi:hypothetical protein
MAHLAIWYERSLLRSLGLRVVRVGSDMPWTASMMDKACSRVAPCFMSIATTSSKLDIRRVTFLVRVEIGYLLAAGRNLVAALRDVPLDQVGLTSLSGDAALQ